MGNDSTQKTVTVAFLLCVVCSVLVSTAAVVLRPKQDANKSLDIKKNLLLAAGLLNNPKATANDVNKAFEVVETKLIDLKTGNDVEGVDIDSFDVKKAAKDPKFSVSIPSNKDIARIRQKSKYGKVYLIKKDGSVDQIVLPFHGKGLWSTMYGFISLAPDTKTVKGIGYYEHGETPGLGGEVDNANWKKSWVGKKVLSDSYSPIVDVIKGSVDSTNAESYHQIDGLSGATMTSNGVEAMVNYWLSEEGYGPFLARFRAGGI
ncbi:MAG: Na(+)-translocating NADH-quinone reductase subunit C [Bdellovibrio sp.]